MKDKLGVARKQRGGKTYKMEGKRMTVSLAGTVGGERSLCGKGRDEK